MKNLEAVPLVVLIVLAILFLAVLLRRLFGQAPPMEPLPPQGGF
jgi:hypothetical protein